MTWAEDPKGNTRHSRTPVVQPCQRWTVTANGGTVGMDTVLMVFLLLDGGLVQLQNMAT